MAKRLGWSRRAKRHIEEIYEYIAADDPQAAEAFVQELLELARGLREHPRIGRVVPEFGREELRERIHGRYRLVYRLLKNDHIQVAAIVHTARRLPNTL